VDSLEGYLQQYLRHVQQATQRLHVPQIRALYDSCYLLLYCFNKLKFILSLCCSTLRKHRLFRFFCVTVIYSNKCYTNKFTVSKLGCSDTSAHSKAAGIISKFIIATKKAIHYFGASSVAFPGNISHFTSFLKYLISNCFTKRSRRSICAS